MRRDDASFLLDMLVAARDAEALISQLEPLVPSDDR